VICVGFFRTKSEQGATESILRHDNDNMLIQRTALRESTKYAKSAKSAKTAKTVMLIWNLSGTTYKFVCAVVHVSIPNFREV